MVRVLEEEYKRSGDYRIDWLEYIYDGNELVARSEISDFVGRQYKIPPLDTGKMVDISGTISKSISLDIGVGILESFLKADILAGRAKSVSARHYALYELDRLTA
jgi:hypothetical protein